MKTRKILIILSRKNKLGEIFILNTKKNIIKNNNKKYIFLKKSIMIV